MRFALCLRGWHYLSNNYIFCDYKESLENMREFIIKPLVDCGHEVDVFCLTYAGPKLQEMLTDYNPNKIYILPHDESANGSVCQRQCIWHMASVHLLEQYETEMKIRYDVIINTRYDLYFHTKITDQSFNMFKFNPELMHPDGSGNCDDAYFIMGRNVLTDFYFAAEKCYNINQMVHIINKCIDPSKLSYMHEAKKETPDDVDVFRYYTFKRKTFYHLHK